VRFTLFSEIEFEVSCPVALIESYCFQSDFYANYDLLLPGRKAEDVNSIGARIPNDALLRCVEVIANIGNQRLFRYNSLDKFLNQDDKVIARLVRGDLKNVIDKLILIKGVGLSKATKVLHTVYPEIIPMIDSMLQEAYIQTKPGVKWTENDSNQIFVAYYKNLKEQPTNHSLAEVYNTVSKNLPGLTKVRVFDILWWSYLKAKRLREKNDIKWATIQ
jgi:hypothetical protein